MATINFQSNPVNSIGELPAVGTPAPDFVLVGNDLSDVKLSDFAGQKVILSIFPSLDTGVCAASVRTFNEKAAGLENTTVLCVSMDLPFAQGRFCGAEGIDDAITVSAFRSSFGKDYGVLLIDSPMRGLLTRSVVIIDEDGTVQYTQIVPEITEEPNYDEVLEHLNKGE